MNQLCVICCTRERPDICRRMVESFYKTSSVAQLILCIDLDDPAIDDYSKIFSDRRIIIHFNINQKTTTGLINEAYDIHNLYQYYSVTNDDFVYETENWDRILIERIKENGGWGIAFGYDGSRNKDIPTTSVINAEYVRLMGWLQYPKLTHLFGDMIWRELGLRTNTLLKCNDVRIIHYHFINKNAEKDGVVERTNSKEMYSKDSEVYRDYLARHLFDDVKRIEDARVAVP